MIRDIIKAILLALKAFFWGQQKLQEHADKGEVADAVENRADELRDIMRDADPDSVQPDDPRLIRPR